MNCLLCKHKNLSLVSRTYINKLGVVVCIVWRQFDPWGSQAGPYGLIREFQVYETPSHKTRWLVAEEQHPGLTFDIHRAHMYKYTYKIHTHIQNKINHFIYLLFGVCVHVPTIDVSCLPRSPSTLFIEACFLPCPPGTYVGAGDLNPIPHAW